MTLSRPLKNIWSILFLPATILSLAACGSGANFTSVPDNFSNFRRANLLASDQPSLTAGQEVLNIGGNAADATVAMGFTAMVSLPARMGLEARGHCVGYDSATAKAFSLNFSTEDYHALHGLSALHASYGKAPWSGILAPARNLALLGGNPFSQRLNSEIRNAPAHLVDAQGQSLPRPIFVKTLEVLRQQPTNYPKFSPFAEQAKWQNGLSLDAPHTIEHNDTLLAHTQPLEVVSFSNGLKPIVTTNSVIFGAIDATGLAISCSAGYATPYGAGWNHALDSAISAPNIPFALPRNIVGYNDQNQRVRWLAAFDSTIVQSGILQNWDALLKNNRPASGSTLGYAMSYCPIGLPNLQVNKDLSCATYSGTLKALGRASRQ